MRISDWSSDVCSSDLHARPAGGRAVHIAAAGTVRDGGGAGFGPVRLPALDGAGRSRRRPYRRVGRFRAAGRRDPQGTLAAALSAGRLSQKIGGWRSEEHTSELQSLMRISYAVFCLKKKNTTTPKTNTR